MELESIIDNEIMKVREWALKELEDELEVLETTTGDSIECVSMENAVGIVQEAFQQIKQLLDEDLRITGIYMERTSKKIKKLEKQLKQKSIDYQNSQGFIEKLNNQKL